MTGFFKAPVVPKEAQSSKPPGITDPQVQLAGLQDARAAATAQGQASTILTSGTGAQQQPSPKKTLLGG